MRGNVRILSCYRSIYNTGNVPGDVAGIIYIERDKNCFCSFFIFIYRATERRGSLFALKGKFSRGKGILWGLTMLQKMGLGFFGGDEVN